MQNLRQFLIQEKQAGKIIYPEGNKKGTDVFKSLILYCEENVEFFEFAEVVTSQEEIRSRVSIDTLPDFCEEIEGVDAAEELGRVVYFRQWGRFHIRQETVMGGVRFSVPDCPNALAWTVTTGYPPCPSKMVLHATINRIEHHHEFIDATKALLAALKTGLERNYRSGATAVPQPFRIPCL